MAQVGRAIKRTLLQILPAPASASLLRRFPNLRKAAPAGNAFVFENYCGDIRVNIDTRYKVERIMWSGTYEPRLTEYLQTQNLAGWMCLDIGANVGAISLLLAKLCGPQGRVFAFEPGPPNLARLRNNLALNPDLESRTEVVAQGMGQSPGELWWAEESGNPGNAVLGQEGSHRVPVNTIDNFVRDRKLAAVDFIKIDVEGMELDVMQGGNETLSRFRPMLYFETLARYGNAHAGNNFRLIEEFLTGRGYGLFRIARRGNLEPATERSLDDYTVAVHTQAGTTSPAGTA
jgi:FkbM family methyltransferase